MSGVKTIAALFGFGLAAYSQPYTPTIVSPGLNEPIGIAMDSTGRVLVTTPFCDGFGSPRGVYNVSSGSAVLLASFSLPVGSSSGYTGPFNSGCSESYIVISNGSGGFPAGNAYVTAGNIVYQVTPAGSVTPFVTLANMDFINNADVPLAFDRVGTFGFNLIVTALGCDTVPTCANPMPTVYLIQSNGTYSSFTVPSTGYLGDVQLEGPEVAPLTFGKYGGYLMVGRESDNNLYAISPIDHSLTNTGAAFAMTPFSATPRPENMKFFPTNPCSIQVAGAGTVAYAQVLYPFNGSPGPGEIAYFSGSLPPNKMALCMEYPTAGTYQTTFVVNPTGQTDPTPYSFFTNGGNVQNEGNAVVVCPLNNHCTLSQGGYKNHYNNLVVNFPLGGLTLGNTLYTNQQLNTSIQANAVGGNSLASLAHQLITAELNIYYGSIPTTQVSVAIVQANALIGNLNILTGSVKSSAMDNLANILNTFNNSNECN